MPSFVSMRPDQFVALADALDARPVVPQVVLGCPCLRREHLDDATRASLERGLEDVRAGRVTPAPSFADFLDERPARFAEVFVDMGGVHGG
jgi:hypothetical protein